MNFSAEADDHSFDFPLIAGDSEAALEDHHSRAKDDYESWKYDFLVWLRVEGKKPDRLEGYSSAVVRGTSYKTDQIMRWLWTQRGYTTELTPDDADELMKTLGRQSDYSDSNLNNFVKTIKRIFSYYNYEKGRDIDWDCKYAISEPRVTNRDYFKKSEFRPLYEAALNHGAVKHYNNCSPEKPESSPGGRTSRAFNPSSNYWMTIPRTCPTTGPDGMNTHPVFSMAAETCI